MQTFESIENLPANFGSNVPLGKQVVELFISGAHQFQSVRDIVSILSRTGFKILNVKLETDPKGLNFASVITLEINKDTKNSEVFDLAEKLMGTGFIRSVELSPRSGRMFSNFHHPVTIGEDIRAVVIPVRSLLEMGSNSMRNVKASSEDAIFRAGKCLGIDLSRICQRNNTGRTQSDMLQQIPEMTRATGWGICQCTPNLNGEVIFTMRNPPVLPNELDARQFLKGLILGLLESCGYTLRIENETYDKNSDSFVFRFVPVDS